MDKLIDLGPEFWTAAGETLYMVFFTMLFGGLAGLVLGIGLYVTRKGGLLPNAVVNNVLNVLINFFRPIPFIIFIAAVQPLTRAVIGIGIGTNAAVFALSLAASFAIGRIVEQNLLTVKPGVIEAARSMGAGPWRILTTVVIGEALGPLISATPSSSSRSSTCRRWRASSAAAASATSLSSTATASSSRS